MGLVTQPLLLSVQWRERSLVRHILFDGGKAPETAILIKESAFYETEIRKHYVNPLYRSGYDTKKVIAFSLEYTPSGKAPAGLCKAYLSNLLPALKKLGVKTLYCADSNYFKALTKSRKSEGFAGYHVPCTYEGFEDMTVILGINYQALLYNPNQEEKLDLTVSALTGLLGGTYTEPGKDIIKWAHYPKTHEEIEKAFAKLHTFPSLTCDIECFSLHPFHAGIGTIAFSPSQEGGVGFACDIEFVDGENRRIFNDWFRIQLRKFFTEYKGNLKYHKAGFDIKVLIYNLWMKDPLDNVGLLEGLDIMYRDTDCTRLVAYLALNSTAGNELGLKTLAHEFAGNWAQDDITNILLIPLPQLLQYNVVDCMSTWYVYNKHFPTVVKDYQKKLYDTMFMPSQKVITQIELVGMPMIPERVRIAKAELTKIRDDIMMTLVQMPEVKQVETLVQTAAMDKKNLTLKTIQHKIEQYAHLVFNPNSNDHVGILLYEVMGLPVIEKTKTGNPSTTADTLDKLEAHAPDHYKGVLKALIQYTKVQKILSSFIPAFEAGFDKGNGRIYLHGNFNLGGTLSGRLSSSDPNLQNLPASSLFAKLVKECFAAPDGWFFSGADFASLEDRINALLTQDPNKIKVYTDGFDGHALRTVAYFGDQITGIDVNSPDSVNTIAEKSSPYYHLRQDSKAPTFALTYLGTWMTLVKNCGFTKEVAQKIEGNFHQLYAASGEWVQNKITQASKDGYGTAAFGLRIRTPLLHKCQMGSKRTLREADAEGRSLGNAVSGQSYGLLNNRAANEFMQRVWASPYRHDILPTALIHDAIYLQIRNKPEVIKFANDNLPDCMGWKGLPEIADPRVPLPAELDIFYPSWANGITLKNHISADEIEATVLAGAQKYYQKKMAATV